MEATQFDFRIITENVSVFLNSYGLGLVQTEQSFHCQSCTPFYQFEQLFRLNIML